MQRSCLFPYFLDKIKHQFPFQSNCISVVKIIHSPTRKKKSPVCAAVMKEPRKGFLGPVCLSGTRRSPERAVVSIGYFHPLSPARFFFEFLGVTAGNSTFGSHSWLLDWDWASTPLCLERWGSENRALSLIPEQQKAGHLTAKHRLCKIEQVHVWLYDKEKNANFSASLWLFQEECSNRIRLNTKQVLLSEQVKSSLLHRILQSAPISCWCKTDLDLTPEWWKGHIGPFPKTCPTQFQG